MVYDKIQKHTIDIYDLENKEYEVLEVPARSLLVGQRFDLFAKLFYIKYRKTDYELALNVYNSHIKAFNPDLKEPGREDKNGYDDFVKTFDALIDEFETNEFNSSLSLIPVDECGILLDGAHRICALAYYNKNVCIVRFQGVKSKCRFDYEYFLKRGLSWKIADIIAYEMVQWSPNMLIACLWPRMGGADVKRETLNIINRRYSLCYTKTITTNLESFVRFIAKVYEHQSWVGTAANGFAGARDKALNCFAANKQITFALFEADNLNDVITFKDEIRQRYKSDKHSIHITDNVDETKDIAYVVFNEDQLATWNQINLQLMQQMKEIIDEKIYYFKHVTLINMKVAIAAVIRRFWR